MSELTEEQVYQNKNKQLNRELESLLNRYSRENRSDTPDFILATFMQQCLVAFEKATRRRENWYGRACPNFKCGSILEPHNGEIDNETD